MAFSAPVDRNLAASTDRRQQFGEGRSRQRDKLEARSPACVLAR